MHEIGPVLVVALVQAPSVYVRAAKGDHDAQLEMARLMMGCGVDGDLSPDSAVSLAMIWGHMASTSGKASHLLGYAGLLLADLSRAGDKVFEEATYEVELATALAVLDVVADAGHELAALLSGALASRMSSSLIAGATALKCQFEVEPLTDEDKRCDAQELQVIAAALATNVQGVC